METSSQLTTFGDNIPFGDPLWYQGHYSPYYTAAHHRFRKHVRAFVDRELMPFVHDWDEAGTIPHDALAKKFRDAGLWAPMWPRKYGGTPPEGSENLGHGAFPGSAVDPFFDLIQADELARAAAGGAMASLFSWSIGLPPIIMFANDNIKQRVIKGVLTGSKRMCLCVTEPTGGSDVSAIKTTAVRKDDHYLVNGQKKWITGGMTADYFTVVCRTGGSGARGLSMLLLEKDMPGITQTRIKTQGWCASNTAFIEFENVKVPLNNLIGKEGRGLKYTLINFNHERFGMAVASNRYARVCLEEAIKYSRRRKTFGKRLCDHQVIRHKIAEMSRRCISTHLMLENYAYQVKCGVPDEKMYGYVALMKVQSTRTMEYCAREASQIFGGKSYTRGSGGSGKVERIYRMVRVMAIGGGSEEIMFDLAMKHAKL